MHRPELLVHVTAPASVRDDRKYLTIAQSIVDFQPARVTHITPEVLDISCSVQRDGHSPIRCTELLSNENDTALSRALPPMHSFPGIEVPQLFAPDHSSFAKWRIAGTQKQKQSSSRKLLSTPGCSLRHPLIEIPSSTASDSSVQVVKSKTVSDLQPSYVLVPFTGKKRQRSPSRSSPLPTHSFRVQDSQASSSTGLGARNNIESRWATDVTDHNQANDTQELELSLSQTSLEDNPPYKKARTHLELRSEHCQKTHNGIPKVDDQQVEECSMDLTSTQSMSIYEEMQNRSSSISTTVSPSQRISITPTHLQTSEVDMEPKETPVVIDLTNSIPIKSREASSHQYTGEDTATNTKLPNQPPVRSYERLYILPYEVVPPPPKVSFDKFSSHITTTLSNIANRLPLEKYFRPVVIARDVKVLERGHWRMSIVIASSDKVLELRAPPTDKEIPIAMEKHFPGETAEQRFRAFANHVQTRNLNELDRDHCSHETRARNVWTEDEYISFWKNVSAFVGDGKAGWGTRLVREEQTSDSPVQGADSEVLNVRIRIFTWGELVGHMWLALWVLSDKLSERVAMEWIAADGTSIVKMAGTRRGQGKLGLWTRKSPPGEGAFWGVVSQYNR